VAWSLGRLPPRVHVLVLPQTPHCLAVPISASDPPPPHFCRFALQLPPAGDCRPPTVAMSGMRAHIASRLRSSSLSAVPPSRQSSSYSTELATAAASILYRSPLPSREGRPVFILNAAAMPDSHEHDFDSLLPYVLARLPEEDDLLKGYEYEVVFFAGDGDGSATGKKHRPGWGWFLQAYHVLSRAMRKRLQKLYIVHEKAWVRILTEIFSTIVSPKFRRKIYHASTLTNLALDIPIEDLLIPPSTYLTDRRIIDDIFAPYASGRRAFAARSPFPSTANGKTRFPRVLRETTSFVLMEENITSEGLFRVPPHSKLRDVLKEAYDRGQKYIVWKDNGVTLPIPHYPQAEHQDEILAEVDPKDAYSVYMAAALIKAWYASLKQPIFPPESYRDLKRLYGDSQDVPDLERLRDLFSPSSEWSFLPSMSRKIVVRHLLPLLDAIAARSEENKMTAENLAVCFAPALLCGPDQIEDAKMSSIVRRIFTQAIPLWSEGLREACGQKESVFREELQLPTNEDDWEDPLEVKKEQSRESLEEQMSGIILQDNEKLYEAYAGSHPDASGSERPPTLPPRRTPSAKSSGDSVTRTSSIARKPAPPLQVPPRYSTVISDAPNDVAESPSTYAATTDGFAPRRDDAAPRPTAKWDPDEKKSGTSNPVPVPISTSQSAAKEAKPSAAPQIILPKRKALTPAQINNAGMTASASTRDAGRSVSAQPTSFQPQSHGGMALPGLTNLPNINTNSAAAPATETKSSPSPSVTAFPAATSPSLSDSQFSPATSTRRPSLPVNTSRSPQITSLARPVYPAPQTRPPSKSTSLPVPASKPRGISPGLLKRMPSLEVRPTQSSAERLAPKKLNLKKQSVEDLRRLYEERAGTASLLVKMPTGQARERTGSIRE
jgi:Rho GTPase-activating protein 1